ncbi:hypothetical protein [Nocardia rhizosphaerae]|uniref:Uncharacterized protein n=1 Tax=Nocardia rhizosphaerae TaxID=1691571 RepID=A0ABV8L4H9_9NOCA
MAESSRTRVIAIAAVLAALLALVVALGLIMRANQGDENDKLDENGVGTPTSDGYADQPVGFAPPWPARRVGGNCSAGGIVAHWQVDDGAWTCTVTTPDAAVPPAPAPPPPPPPEPVPVYEPPPPVYEPPPPVYVPPPPPPEPEPEIIPVPAPPPPAPPPPPVIQLPFPLPPIVLPPAAAVLP